MIDSGFKALKLVLMGIITLAIPILFIIQANKIEKEKEEKTQAKNDLCELKGKISQLEGIIVNKEDIIKFYATVTPTTEKKLFPPIDFVIRRRDTITAIIFSKDINQLIVQNGTIRSANQITYLYDTLPISQKDASHLISLCQHYTILKYRADSINRSNKK